MKCQVDQCRDTANVRIFEPRADGTLYHPLLCESHAFAVLRRYARECAEMETPSAEASSPTFKVACIATTDANDIAPVYLRGADGSCFFFTTGKLEAWMLGALLSRDATKDRSSPHETMAAIVDGLGGELREVVIDEFAHDAYHAKLQIAQCGRHVSLDVRASDAVALALGTQVPLRVTPQILARSAEQAAQSPLGIAD